jgi:hypothetical protein
LPQNIFAFFSFHPPFGAERFINIYHSVGGVTARRQYFDDDACEKLGFSREFRPNMLFLERREVVFARISLKCRAPAAAEK